MTRRYNMAMRLWLTGLGVIFSGLFVWTATVEAGYRGPFEGRVIDAETRQPIQGAVVFVEWSLGTPTPAGRVDEFYDAAEVLTDNNGYFSIKKKSSWNPWTNWMLEARGLIYKAGYGAATNLGTPWLRARAESLRARTEEERRKLGPDFYFDIEFDDDLPVFLLRRLTTAKERTQSLGVYPIFSPPEMTKLLIDERNREARALGREDAVIPVPNLAK